MAFELSENQIAIQEAVRRTCAPFTEDYWLRRDEDGEFPEEFYTAMARDGWLGVAIPEEFGGSGLGVTEAALVMQTIAETGACMTGCSSVHINIFGLMPIVVFGTDEQRRRWLPGSVSGQVKSCFGVTEPNTGLNTTQMKTRAERRGDCYVVSGQKVWISTAQVAHKILLLVRTTPLDECKSRTDGLTLFYTDLDRNKITVRRIPKMGRKAVDSNELFIDQLEVPMEDRIGEEGKGFIYILHGMNPERILIAAEAIGIGNVALSKATSYAADRIVFNRPIGKNQAIQHPLAVNWMELQAATLMMHKAAWLYDNKKDCAAEANAAKYLAAEAGYHACECAVLTHGGFGYAKEYHVERYLRESLIPRIAPISRELILCHIAERVLGLPKSY